MAAARVFVVVGLAAGFTAGLSAASASALPARDGDSRSEAASVRTLLALPYAVEAFAQSGSHLAWLRSTRRCRELFVQRLGTGARTSLARRCDATGGADDPELGLSLLVGATPYWTHSWVGNTVDSQDLYTLGRRGRFRRLESQTIAGGVDGGSLDRLVAPISDGRSVYFWIGYFQGPGAIRRFDGPRASTVTGPVSRLHLTAAGGGRFAYAQAEWTHDCARDPAWSPDGRRIAFASRPGWEWYGRRDPMPPCRGGIWIVGADGRGLEQVAERGTAPDWGPDGRLAYEDGEGAIVVASAGAEGPVVKIGAGSDPAWAPDGARLAFVRAGSVFVSAADGTGARLVAPAAAQPEWSPDGTRLAVARPGERRGIWIVAADGSGERRLTTGYDASPAWSPNGRWIAYVDDEARPPGPVGQATRIMVVPPEGGTARRIKDADSMEPGHGGWVTAPAWSPDSSRLVFALASDFHDEGDSHLFVAAFPASGAARGPVRECCERRLTSTPRPRTPVSVRTATGAPVASFVPDGEALALAVTRTTIAALVRRDGTRRLDIYAPGRHAVAFSTATAPELVASGSTIVVRVSRALYAVDARTGRRRLLARAGGRPIGLSFAGRRLAWAENRGGRAYLRAVEVAP